MSGDGPRWADPADRALRRRAAGVVARAFVGHPLWWAGALTFGALAGWNMVEAIHAAATPRIYYAVVAVTCLVVATGLVPLLIGLTAYTSTRLAYLDTGAARAVMCVRDDHYRGARPGDQQAHTFGSFPQGKGAGRLIGEWVKDQIDAGPGRLTAIALPKQAARYERAGMLDQGTAWRFLRRLASKP